MKLLRQLMLGLYVLLFGELFAQARDLPVEAFGAHPGQEREGDRDGHAVIRGSWTTLRAGTTVASY